MTIKRIVKEIEVRIAALEEKDNELYYQIIRARDNDRKCEKYRARRSKVESEKTN